MRKTLVILATAALSFAGINVQAQNTIFVDHLADSGTANGQTWQTAFPSLQDALDAVESGDEIWISEGVYTPDIGSSVTQGDRAAIFRIPEGVKIYGGFGSEESSPSERNLDNHKTILSGDLDQNDEGDNILENPSRIDNAYGILVFELILELAVLDGVTISGAHGNDRDFATQALESIYSVGVLEIKNVVFADNVSLGSTIRLGDVCPCNYFGTVFENVTIENNYGREVGGISSFHGNVKLIRTTIASNRSEKYSAIQKFEGEIAIIGSEIRDNISTGSHTIWMDGENSGYLGIWSSRLIGNRVEGNSGGGAVTLSESHLQSVNNVYSGNQTAYDGGAIFLGDFTAEIVNDLFAFNFAAGGGGAISTRDKQVTLIANSIFYKNASSEGSTLDVKGNHTIDFVNSIIDAEIKDGTIGNYIPIIGEPSFKNDVGIDQIGGTIDDDFRTVVGSLSIDSGDPSALPIDRLDLDGDGDTEEVLPLDLAGNLRMVSTSGSGGSVDIGPYEFGSTPSDISNDQLKEIPTPNKNCLVTIHPVPSDNSVSVSMCESSRFVRFELFDGLGKSHGVKYDGMMLQGESFQIDVSKYSKGIYYLFDQLSGSVTSLIVL